MVEYIVFPLTTVSAGEKEPEFDMAESAPSRPPLVLIANGQEWSIRSLESILAPHGYAVLRAFSGHQAVELALRLPSSDHNDYRLAILSESDGSGRFPSLF